MISFKARFRYYYADNVVFLEHKNDDEKEDIPLE